MANKIANSTPIADAVKRVMTGPVIAAVRRLILVAVKPARKKDAPKLPPATWKPG